MKKTVSLILLALSLVVLLAPVAFAEEAAAASAPGDAKLKYYAVAALACGIAIGVAAFGASIGQGMGLKGATEGIARNPGASGKITTTLIIGLAMIESLAIYALVVALILLFVNPFKV
ncbi:ATP synthase F0, C subunit [Candidatus Sulfobium mesophilum]|uniref:ATP synthase subunit c n=1 Tax=Candidatus Sulfobium mesophilum TaxID=2016548 RepID=A0A2U3QGR5_9BACT|nr:ATP synthase F0, C subunit [Candidatus Sulfobium mesophilum]